MAPQIAKFLLSSHIPYNKFDGFIVELFNIEAYGRDSMNGLSEFEGI